MIKKIKSNAKINIGLNIKGKLSNGYHLLDMIMAPITLSDEIEIDFTGDPGTLIIKTNREDIPIGKENILYKVYEAFYNKTGIANQNIELYLEKKIPHQAGLGGGSSNGGAFLKELNLYHGNPLSLEEMVDISKGIGADIPFFLVNKTCRINGIGEKLQIKENNLECDILLIKPPFGVSTGKAYNDFSKLENKKDANIEKILEGLKENKLSDVLNNIENHLEQALLIENEDLRSFKKFLDSLKFTDFFMSGSGSAYFSLVEKKNSREVYSNLKGLLEGCEVYLCSFS
ncbi:4-(cytidine 5'-diphospho)-2-C-methyl-D-erythritol kinase [uncultured Ilyobacter sp.]|uniref:4-(cytidine 5'-diphospho)-2-C-methyl-D-erythritol kinase n=1 Tax=uncultured Ilyobacter sp. TaxID=544433 RepID=UPI0029F4B77A|nr:4-(cytidine 5'-diphospho)-2-C-methyl-D-erythritol kinase [uncultured Ilyobacter sp.]